MGINGEPVNVDIMPSRVFLVLVLFLTAALLSEVGDGNQFQNGRQLLHDSYSMRDYDLAKTDDSHHSRTEKLDQSEP
ncbi:hypothetical protein AYI96_06525 [Shewanella sp. MSW]|nr:hypothetical protein AYI96_06525 [Shewanella sp. MSW]